MKKIICLLLTFSLCFCSLAARETAKLYAIIVADLSAANIESIVEKDLGRLLGEIARISKYTHLKLREKIFLGALKDPKRLYRYIKHLKVQPNDVLLFYFSGHGSRTPQEESAWPSLAFEEADMSLRFEEIASLLVQKQARLNLFFADCCNNIMLTDAVPRLFKLKAKNENCISWVQDNINGYRKLFLKSTGILMAASASPGEYSQGSETGSVFTEALVRAIQDTFQNAQAPPSWQKVMENVESLILKLKIQEPKDFSIQHPYIFDAITEYDP